MKHSILVLVLTSAMLAAFTPQANAQVRAGTIGGTSYVAGDVPSLAGRIAKTPAVKLVLAAIKACPQAHAYAFVSTRGAGLVAWVPDSVFGCFGTSGGGPLSSPCLQGFHT